MNFYIVIIVLVVLIIILSTCLCPYTETFNSSTVLTKEEVDRLFDMGIRITGNPKKRRPKNQIKVLGPHYKKIFNVYTPHRKGWYKRSVWVRWLNINGKFAVKHLKGRNGLDAKTIRSLLLKQEPTRLLTKEEIDKLVFAGVRVEGDRRRNGFKQFERLGKNRSIWVDETKQEMTNWTVNGQVVKSLPRSQVWDETMIRNQLLAPKIKVSPQNLQKAITLSRQAATVVIEEPATPFEELSLQEVQRAIAGGWSLKCLLCHKQLKSMGQHAKLLHKIGTEARSEWYKNGELKHIGFLGNASIRDMFANRPFKPAGKLTSEEIDALHFLGFRIQFPLSKNIPDVERIRRILSSGIRFAGRRSIPMMQVTVPFATKEIRDQITFVKGTNDTLALFHGIVTPFKDSDRLEIYIGDEKVWTASLIVPGFDNLAIFEWFFNKEIGTIPILPIQDEKQTRHFEKNPKKIIVENKTDWVSYTTKWIYDYVDPTTLCKTRFEWYGNYGPSTIREWINDQDTIEKIVKPEHFIKKEKLPCVPQGIRPDVAPVFTPTSIACNEKLKGRVLTYHDGSEEFKKGKACHREFFSSLREQFGAQVGSGGRTVVGCRTVTEPTDCNTPLFVIALQIKSNIEQLGKILQDEHMWNTLSILYSSVKFNFNQAIELSVRTDTDFGYMYIVTLLVVMGFKSIDANSELVGWILYQGLLDLYKETNPDNWNTFIKKLRQVFNLYNQRVNSGKIPLIAGSFKPINSDNPNASNLVIESINPDNSFTMNKSPYTFKQIKPNLWSAREKHDLLKDWIVYIQIESPIKFKLYNAFKGQSFEQTGGGTIFILDPSLDIFENFSQQITPDLLNFKNDIIKRTPRQIEALLISNTEKSMENYDKNAKNVETQVNKMKGCSRCISQDAANLINSIIGDAKSFGKTVEKIQPIISVIGRHVIPSLKLKPPSISVGKWNNKVFIRHNILKHPRGDFGLPRQPSHLSVVNSLDKLLTKVKISTSTETTINLATLTSISSTANLVGVLGTVAAAGSTISNVLGTIGLVFSDSRLKENIKHVGTKNNHDLFEFNYIGNKQKYKGVMAQNILQTCPEAVVTHPNGFYMVDYNKLGLTMEIIH